MILVEFIRQLRRVRTWVAFGVLAGLPVIVAIAQRLNPDGGGGDGPPSLIYALGTASGINHTLASLAFMSPFFLIIVVCSFAGESVAGEATWGTLRYLLLRPVRRSTVIASKFAVSVALALAGTLAIVTGALVSGSIAFGWKGAAIGLPVGNAIIGPTLSMGDSLVRLAVAVGYVAWGTVGILAFSFLISTLTDHASGAIGAGIGIAIASQILDGLSAFDWLHPYLPTHYWSAWTALFLPPPLTSEFAKGLIVPGVYAIVLGGIALRRFSRKDILS